MRDPARINRIVEKLQRAWCAHPDLRLGQLLHHLVNPCPEAYVEDDALEQKLDAFIERGVEAL